MKEDDDPQCVIHYPELTSNKPSRIILLSDRSYSKLIECKNVRTELGAEFCHDQCETIPFPNYDPKRDGYHRSCYMNFVKIKMENMKTSSVDNCTENQSKTKDENCSDESKTQQENDSHQSSTELQDHTQSIADQINTDHSHTNHELGPENQCQVIHEDYFVDSKTKDKNLTNQSIHEHGNYTNESKNEHHFGIHSTPPHETVYENSSDQTENLEHKDCSAPSNTMKHRNYEDHKKTKFKDHNGFQKE